MKPGFKLGLASPATALTVGGLVLALVVIDVPLARLAHQGLNASGGSSPVWFSAALGAVGFVVASRKPRNPLGWILLGGAMFSSLSQDASFYAVADYRLRHGGLPLGWVAVLAQPGWAAGIVLTGLAVLLFPTAGRRHRAGDGSYGSTWRQPRCTWSARAATRPASSPGCPACPPTYGRSALTGCGWKTVPTAG